MSVQRIAFRYAKSLLDLSVERNELETVLADMEYISKSLESRDLFLLLKSPIITTGKKHTIIKRLFSEPLSKLTNSFLDIMLRKGRENLLPEIVEAFKQQYKAHQKISTVVLRTAEALDKDTIDAIKSKLSQSSETHEKIDLQVIVDPELIGGFTLEFEGKQYNASVAHKLQQLRKEFAK